MTTIDLVVLFIIFGTLFILFLLFSYMFGREKSFEEFVIDYFKVQNYDNLEKENYELKRAIEIKSKSERK